MVRRVAVLIALVTGALLFWAPVWRSADAPGTRAGSWPARGAAPSPAARWNTANYFDPGRATLKPTSKKALREVVGTLRADPTSTVRLEGHTNAVGSERNNKTLAKARANTVATYLERHGIGGPRIHAVGMGEAGPVADNATEEGRAKTGG